MADLSVTAANVLKGADASLDRGTAGATITAGQLVYFDSATSSYKLADNNSGTAAARSPVGIALHGSLTGQPLTIQRAGLITVGATMTAGVAYYLSGTPGGLAPIADLTTGMYPTLIGIAKSTTVLNIDIQEAGVAL